MNNSSVKTVDDDEERVSLTFGVSLAHLISLPVPYEKEFKTARDYVMDCTNHMVGYRSYARWLESQPQTKHLVRDKATVFVSYAWSGGFGKTMDALKEHFKDNLDETFVWMDFAIVDQHKAATTNIDFDQWAKIFGESLKIIGRACLVLTPVEKPIATSRSWCCFEWTTIAKLDLPYSYAVPPEDEQRLIEQMQNGMLEYDDFKDIFAGINVERARAWKPEDRQQILSLMKQVGIVVVNDIVMTKLKEWLVKVAIKAESNALQNSPQLQLALDARASLHYALGELNIALPYLEKSLYCAMEIPNNELNLALQLNNLAGCLRATGDYASAELLYRKVLVLRQKSLGNTHLDVALSATNLAGLLTAMGKYTDAEQLAREALVILKKTTSKGNCSSVTVCLNNLAGVLKAKGKYRKAEPLYYEILALCRDSFGDNHPDVAATLNNLAGLLEARGDYKTAEEMCREAIAIEKKTLGVDHPDLARSLNNLAGVLRANGDYRAAEPLLRKALAIRTKELGENHPDLANSYNNLGGLLYTMGDYAAAEPLYRHALEIWKETFGEKHTLVATALSNIAALWKVQRKLIEAKTFFEESLAIQREVLGLRHPDVATTLWWLAEIEDDVGNRTEALKLAKKALRISAKALGVNHPDTKEIRSFIEEKASHPRYKIQRSGNVAHLRALRNGTYASANVPCVKSTK